MATCSRLTVALFMLLAATRPAPTSAEDDDDDDLFDFQIHAMCRLRGFEKPDTPSQIINRGCLLQCFDSTGRHIAHYAVNRSTCSSVGQCHYGRCYLKGSPNLENQYNYVSFSILVSTVQMKFGRNEQPQDLQLAILYDRNNSDGLSYERGQIICRPNKMFRFSKSPEIDLKVQCDLMPINKDAYLEFQLLGDEGVTYVRTFKQKLKTMLGAGKIQFPLDELDEYMEVEIIGSDTPAYND